LPLLVVGWHAAGEDGLGAGELLDGAGEGDGDGAGDPAFLGVNDVRQVLALCPRTTVTITFTR
jgi:hypothetical protein